MSSVIYYKHFFWISVSNILKKLLNINKKHYSLFLKNYKFPITELSQFLSYFSEDNESKHSNNHPFGSASFLVNNRSVKQEFVHWITFILSSLKQPAFQTVLKTCRKSFQVFDLTWTKSERMDKIKYKNIKLIELMVLGATVTAKYFCKQIFKWSTCQRHDTFFYSSDQQQTKSIEFLLVLTLEVMSALDLFRSTAQADSQCLSLYVLWKKKWIKKQKTNFQQ